MKLISRLTQIRTQALRWMQVLVQPKTGVAAIGALVLAGGMSAHQVAQAGGERAIGTLFGAGVGAVAGQQFGGREGAIVGGAIGAVVGNQLAHSSHRGSIIFGPPIWSGGRHYRDDRRHYDNRRGHRARDRRHRRIERIERRAYRDGYREGRRDARRDTRHRGRHHRRWEARY